MLLASTFVGVVAGILSHAAGNNVPGAILTSGAAFAGTVGLLLALAHYTAAEAGR
jgi:predicted branched-subunit amino acid permease